MNGGAVGYAIGAALFIALGSALQHQAVAGADVRRGGITLVLRLTRNGRWMAGLAAAGVGTLLHAVALRGGALAVVEPVLAMNLALALPVRALLDRARPSVAHIAAAAVFGVGVAVFVITARPSAGQPAADGSDAAVLILGGVALAGLCTLVAARTSSERIAGVALGLAAGALYGVGGGALKAAVHTVLHNPAAAFTGWPLWTLCALTAWAFVIHQQAYARAPLRVSLPVLSVANPLAGMTFGAVAFGEIPAHSPVAASAEAVGLAIIVGSVLVLTRPEPHRARHRRQAAPRATAKPHVPGSAASQLPIESAPYRPLSPRRDSGVGGEPVTWHDATRPPQAARAAHPHPHRHRSQLPSRARSLIWLAACTALAW